MAQLGGTLQIYKQSMTAFAHALHDSQRTPDGYAAAFAKHFPKDDNTLKSAFGVLYNYWGLRSICEMYASDYVEEVQNDAFLQFIPTINFCLMNIMMHGWLDKQNIEKSIPLYINTLFPLIEKYKLI